MARSNGLNNWKLFNLYSNSPAFIFGFHWSSSGLLRISIILKHIPMYYKFSSIENICMRLWEGFSQTYYMFEASAFCMTEGEATFPKNSFHAKYMNTGIYPRFPAMLQNQPQHGSCAIHGMHRPVHSHMKLKVLWKTKSSYFPVLVVLVCSLDLGDAGLLSDIFLSIPSSLVHEFLNFFYLFFP